MKRPIDGTARNQFDDVDKVCSSGFIIQSQFAHHLSNIMWLSYKTPSPLECTEMLEQPNSPAQPEHAVLSNPQASIPGPFAESMCCPTCKVCETPNHRPRTTINRLFLPKISSSGIPTSFLGGGLGKAAHPRIWP